MYCCNKNPLNKNIISSTINQMLEVNQGSKNSLWLIIKIFLILAGIFFLVFPYFKAWVATNQLEKEVTTDTLCENKKSELKYSVAIEYKKAKKSAKIYCIYKDSENNAKLNISKSSDKWVISSRHKLDNEGLYWPIYL